MQTYLLTKKLSTKIVTKAFKNETN